MTWLSNAMDVGPPESAARANMIRSDKALAIATADDIAAGGSCGHRLFSKLFMRQQFSRTYLGPIAMPRLRTKFILRGRWRMSRLILDVVSVSSCMSLNGRWIKVPNDGLSDLDTAPSGGLRGF